MLEFPTSEEAKVTCVHRLPAHGEGGLGLDDVPPDGAAVIGAGHPGDLGVAVRDLVHRHGLGGARGTWLAQTINQAKLAFSVPQRTLSVSRSSLSPPSLKLSPRTDVGRRHRGCSQGASFSIVTSLLVCYRHDRTFQTTLGLEN